VINFNFPMKNGITYSFTIGGGGVGRTGLVRANGGNGTKTSLSWTDTTSYRIDVSGGGGGGGGNVTPAQSGGSGGGACGYRNTYLTGASENKNIGVTGGPISYTYTNNIISGPGSNNIPTIGSYSGTFTDKTTNSITSYANKGGNSAGTWKPGGGGGGAFALGSNSSQIGNNTYGGNGGNGITITNTSIIVGGGGGGGSANSSDSFHGNGGTGGGGNGGNAFGTHVGGAGTANTGGGGGGSSGFSNAPYGAGNGGSGVVYVFF
jgi:hypothetical protein